MNRMNPLARLLLALLGLLLPAVALAHAFPVHAAPGAGAVLAQAPAVVSIRFDSRLEPSHSTLIVKDPEGVQVSTGKGTVDAHDATLISTRLTVARKGAYHVYWHAETPDGHRTEGDYVFTVR